ncbi:hypothetical protein METBIDRAFT_32614 [Metschnikowia bicuspidata var. bicuspidata NRRL YB-4993]|uniref:Uncharacterized protein n=1 Tax=Metschnikowia bicuspidata var. bicuspidata NRRL YB-4993 TaxID=869754 RepID=A0A1A0H9E9_9ASCO|nr:hypothetical protein METBIDRAFT_32614 [Metschnikowia bicuspidata var. bicuspidata NRRL YB-4993]OBA20646.1 hypothetical protein METBIDRAFT_32614 [Metschnikowia bicuspidata var. bicuspidata NRRL YB-4993]
MKQIYTHTQLLALRHECQEEAARMFFAACRAQLVYLDLHSDITYRSHSPGLYTSPHSRVSVRYTLRPAPKSDLCRARASNGGATKIHPGSSNSGARPGRGARKNEVPAFESFHLVKIPLSFGELPRGSKIIRVKPGIPVPANAIPVSIAEISEARHGADTTLQPKPKAASGHGSSPKWNVSYEAPSVDGVTYFAAGPPEGPANFAPSCPESPAYFTAPGPESPAYFTPAAGGEWAGTGATGARLGPATDASSETVVSSENRFQYAPYFEPYMRKQLAAGPPCEGLKAKGVPVFQRSDAVAAAITPTTSYESESATEYSSDSSNIQIQLPA